MNSGYQSFRPWRIMLLLCMFTSFCSVASSPIKLSLLIFYTQMSLLLLLLLSSFLSLPLFLSVPTPPPPPSSPCPLQDRLTLLDFLRAVSPNQSVLNWTFSLDCCSWRGVTCAAFDLNNTSLQLTQGKEILRGSLASSTSRVVALSLPSMGLKARLPAILGNLTALRTLNLSGNLFYGTIPSELSSLADLRILDLSFNNLSGSLSVLDNMQSVQIVDISRNRLFGSLPNYRNLSNLKKLNASYNLLQGNFDTNVCEYATDLSELDYSSNLLDGHLGLGLGRCTQLQELYLGHNSLTGSIPEDMFNATSLSALWLPSNNLTGPLKESVGYLANLTQLVLSSNQIVGALPSSLSRNSKLKVLRLDNNLLEGSINVDFANMTHLEELNLNLNDLSGGIPTSLANCSSLRTLNLARNNLVGQIPMQFNSLKSLTAMSLSTNLLNGSLFSVEGCEKLASLVLTKNFFTEPLPSTINGLTNLQVLALGFLNLRGKIPVWLQNCTKLQVLDFSWNQLDGEIPDWLGNFQHLFYLELSNNSFTGTIPPQLFKLTSMMRNDTNTTGMQDLADILAVQRQANSPDLTYNQAKALPPSLYLSNNHLSGVIPPEIGHLKLLVDIDMSHNNLSGSIPGTLANVQDLERLDLSYNNLSGVIPSTLIRLTFLAIFNVSYNNLSGQIPFSNQFTTFSDTSYEGNLGLCGAPILQSCENQTRAIIDFSARRGTKTTAILVSICIGVGVVTLFGVVFFCMLPGRTAVHQEIDSSIEMCLPESLSEARDISLELFHNQQKFTLADILRATNNFDSANIVGCGGFGFVYRADLGDGLRLAIKKLTGDCSQMEREFRAEVEALSKAQHRNLVSLQGFCHIGNHKLLIYSYMENGSLDYWLHERSDGGALLDWSTRVKIAQGAAAALAYLHQICDPHIVHRDIKSSNILLDERFEAHLADFGLARLMMSTETHVTTELVGTLGYIPPEYGGALTATRRGDVYSFGVVLLELLTGKRPVDVSKPRGSGDLVSWVQQMKQDNKLDQIFDNLMQRTSHEVQMRRVLEIACLCINRDPLKRPVIEDIVFWLDEAGRD